MAEQLLGAGGGEINLTELDGVDLFAPACPVRVIITMEALNLETAVDRLLSSRKPHEYSLFWLR